MYNFLEELVAEERRILFLLEKDYRNIERLSNGWLQERHRDSKTTYYEVDTKRKAISKAMEEDSSRVQEIRQFRFSRERIKLLENNRHLLEKIIKKYQEYSVERINAKLASPYRMRTDASGKVYGKKANTKKKSRIYRRRFGNDKCFITADGTYVRSMAEVVIYNLLLQYNIPFVYEPSVELGDGSFIAPDFVIKLRNGKVIYWEHVGMFGDTFYKENFITKLEKYYNNNILPGSNLILTFSSKEYEVNAMAYDKIIRRLILPEVDN